MSGLNSMGGLQAQQQSTRQQPQQRAGISGTTYTPNMYLQNQLATLYGRMGQPAGNPFAQLGGGYMWQPPGTSRSQYAQASPQFPAEPRPGMGAGNPNGYNSEFSGP